MAVGTWAYRGVTLACGLGLWAVAGYFVYTGVGIVVEANVAHRLQHGEVVSGMKYTMIIEKGRESGYVAYVPVLKGCVSQGRTKSEALRNVKEAMEAFVEALLEDGLPVPMLLYSTSPSPLPHT